jgi:hypothetical protein
MLSPFAFAGESARRSLTNVDGLLRPGYYKCSVNAQNAQSRPPAALGCVACMMRAGGQLVTGDVTLP